MNYPKYQQVAEAIRKDIINGIYEEGKVIPTEAKLQEIFNVSRHTIRQALATLNLEGYLRSEKGSGTYVKSRLISPNTQAETKKIGVITTYLSDYIFPDIIRGIEEVLRQNNYSLVLASTDNDIVQEEICLKKMLEENVTGLIVEPTKSNLFNPNVSYYTQFNELGIPLLFINAYYETLELPYIAMDDIKSTQTATEYLLNNHTTELCLITKFDDLQGKLRMKGFIKAIEKANLRLYKDEIITYTTETLDEVLENLVNSLIVGSNLIRTFVCYNDKVAIRFLSMLGARDSILLNEIKLISHDNSILSEAGGFSSMNHLKDELGRRAAKKIIEKIEKNKNLTTEIFSSELILR